MQSLWNHVFRGNFNIYILTALSLCLKFVIEIVYTILMIQSAKTWYTKELLSKRQLLGLLAFPIYSIVIIYSMLAIGNIFFLRYGFWLLAIHSAILLVIDIYCLYIFYQFSSRHEMENKLKVLDMENQLKHDYYATLDERLNNTKRLMHDIKNHLNVIEQLYENGQTDDGSQYVQQIDQMLDALGMQYYTENKLLNMIINDKVNKAANEHIRVDAQIYHLPIESMAPVDITTIFTNLLDNAIAGAKNSANKYIEIKSETFNDMLIIKISNSTVSEEIPQYGLGLVNVSKTLEKYKGSLDISLENYVFTVVIMLAKFQETEKEA